MEKPLKNSKMARPIKDILKEARKTKKLQRLTELWNEIADNKRQYSLSELYNANKKIRKRALKAKDESKYYFYCELMSQSKYYKC